MKQVSESFEISNMATKNEKLISIWLKSFNSQCTIKNYLADLNQFDQWLKKKDLLSAKEQDIRNYILDLEEKDLAKRTRNRRLATIKVILWLALGKPSFKK